MAIVSHSVFKDQKKTNVFFRAVHGAFPLDRRVTYANCAGGSTAFFNIFFRTIYCPFPPSLCSVFGCEQGGSSYAHQLLMQPVFVNYFFMRCTQCFFAAKTALFRAFCRKSLTPSGLFRQVCRDRRSSFYQLIASANIPDSSNSTSFVLNTRAGCMDDESAEKSTGIRNRACAFPLKR
jgi:hypothetical protein